MAICDVPTTFFNTRKKTDELLLLWLAKKETRQLLKKLLSFPGQETDREKDRDGNRNYITHNHLVSSPPVFPLKEYFSEIKREITSSVSSPSSPQQENIESLFKGKNNPTIYDFLAFCNLPRYFSTLLERCLGSKTISQIQFAKFYDLKINNKDVSHRLFSTLVSPGQNHITPTDIALMLLELVKHHPSLGFMYENPDICYSYIRTITVNIFYHVGHQHRDKISWNDFRKAKVFIESLQTIMDISDLTFEPKYFEYSTYHTIHHKFQELDIDCDGFLELDDLLKYNRCALNWRIINSVYYQAYFPLVVPVGCSVSEPKNVSAAFSYESFIWFILSEEDKTTRRALKLWFSCCDHDQDGYLSESDMFYFYENQIYRMECMFLDVIPFSTVCTQIFQMVWPTMNKKISLIEIKKKGGFVAKHIFNILFNHLKFIQSQNDYVWPSKLTKGLHKSDWDKFVHKNYTLAMQTEPSDPEQNS